MIEFRAKNDSNYSCLYTACPSCTILRIEVPAINLISELCIIGTRAMQVALEIRSTRRNLSRRKSGLS